MTEHKSDENAPVGDEEFDQALLELVEESSPNLIVATGGVYEILSEAWNNDILKRALENR